MKNEVKLVQIVLSTYNGEKYLAEQLDSLLNQAYPYIEVLIRDDGSTDGTIDILKKYSVDKRIKVFFGENIGVVQSFFKLLEMTSPSAAYIAFCDQDDVWQKEKVSRAVALLEQEDANVPLLYCSSLILVDEQLRILVKRDMVKRAVGLENALIENIATGCTCVINQKAKQKAMQQIPTDIIMHDWWFYLVVSAFGKVVYDHESYIWYRQHGGNVVGSGVTEVGRWKRRLRDFRQKEKMQHIKQQASNLEQIYGRQLKEKQRLIQGFIHKDFSVMERYSYLKKNHVYRQSMIDDIVFKLILIVT